MEVHMVHESSKRNGKSKIAVVGLLYKIGRPDPLLAKVTLFLEFIFQSPAELLNAYLLVSVVKLHKKNGGC